MTASDATNQPRLMCGISRHLRLSRRGQRARRPRGAARDAGPHGGARAGRRGRVVVARTARRLRPPAAGDHRPVRARRAADAQRRRTLVSHLQRRDLQLPRTARASSRRRAHASAPTSDTEVLLHLYARRRRGDAARAARHVRLRDLGCAEAASCSWPATRTASSRSTTPMTAGRSASRRR